MNLLINDDCLVAMKLLPDNSIDSVCCDPPYHLTSIVKRFGSPDAAPAKHGTDGAFARASRGFMGKEWDGGDIAFRPETWREVLRVLKPGGHMVAFSGSRTYHRMVVAIEDAGFEIRDQIMWLYGTGFPKSHDVSKGIDSRKDWKSLERLGAAIKEARTRLGISQTEAARRVGLIGSDESLGGGGFMWFETGRMPTRDEWPKIKEALSLSNEFDEAFEAAEREIIGTRRDNGGRSVTFLGANGNEGHDWNVTKPATPEAQQWQGWGTALKPAHEPIVLARKPLIGTVAQNVLTHGTGAINIDASRVEASPADRTEYGVNGDEGSPTANVYGERNRVGYERPTLGRWPANLIHDGSDEVIAAFPSTGPSKQRTGARAGKSTGILGEFVGQPDVTMGHTDNGGSAARFFYSTKASKADRAGSSHPTVKPLDLMRYLITLVTPSGGTVLDLFAGSGTTPKAAHDAGFRFVAIERETEYFNDMVNRMQILDAHGRNPTTVKLIRKTETGGYICEDARGIRHYAPDDRRVIRDDAADLFGPLP